MWMLLISNNLRHLSRTRAITFILQKTYFPSWLRSKTAWKHVLQFSDHEFPGSPPCVVISNSSAAESRGIHRIFVACVWLSICYFFIYIYLFFRIYERIWLSQAIMHARAGTRFKLWPCIWKIWTLHLSVTFSYLFFLIYVNNSCLPVSLSCRCFSLFLLL